MAAESRTRTDVKFWTRKAVGRAIKATESWTKSYDEEWQEHRPEDKQVLRWQPVISAEGRA
jgi:hypothetical protein